MVSSPSTLGVVEDHYVAYEDERIGWFRYKSMERTITYLDWTIDGRPLRELVRGVDGSVPREVTVLQNDWSALGVGRSLLESLLGLPARGGFDVAMPDGRIALLFCPTCFDLGCGTLTTEVEICDRFVEWRNIAWQVGYDPLDLTDSEFDPPTLTFDRAQYETELKRLLNLERARLSGGS